MKIVKNVYPKSLDSITRIGYDIKIAYPLLEYVKNLNPKSQDSITRVECDIKIAHRTQRFQIP